MKKYCLTGEIAPFDFHSESGLWNFCGPKSLKAFLADLHAGEKAEIEISSPGGSVVAGVEMANAIKNSGAHLVAHVTGVAASMASVIACACDEIVLEEASFMMIHDPWADAAGNADELRKAADVLDQMKKLCLSFYRSKFVDVDEAKLAEMMSRETYMTANECLAAGLNCRVVTSDVRFAACATLRKMPACVSAHFNTVEMPADVRAAVEAAARMGSAPAPSDADADHGTATPAPKGAEPASGDWEARYKGASKKINELQSQISALEETASAAANKVKDLTSQIESMTEDLAGANARVSELESTLNMRDQELAANRQQLDALKSSRTLLTGGVLTPRADGASYAARMAAAKTPEEREALRAQKRAGQIN